MSTHEPVTELQGPGRSTVDRVLDAAGALLDEVGLPGFNTNAIAKRAGVNVATLYHHFTDKNDVLLRLAERIDEGRSRFFRAVVSHPGVTGDWEALARLALRELHRLRREVPGSLGVRRALAAVPEVSERATEILSRSAADLASAFHEIGGLEEGRSRTSAAVLVEMAASALDLAAFRSDDPEGILDECAVAVIAYLKVLFPALASPPPE